MSIQDLKGQLDYLTMIAKDNQKTQTVADLSKIFDEVAKVADAVTDPDLKTRLKVAAAVGQEKLKNLNN